MAPDDSPHKFLGLRLPSYYERQRDKEERALEPVEFAPVRRNPFKPQTRIRMLNSLTGKFKNGKRYELIGGRDYWVDEEKADEFIIKGYATGKLSRDYTEMEIAQIRSNVQVIAVTSSSFKETPNG